LYQLKLHLHGAEVKDVVLETGREYTFGRGGDCDVQLEEQHGISRMHFKIAEDNGQWTAQVMSKFGDLSHAGQKVQHVILEPGVVFKLGPYDFYFVDQKPQETSQQVDQSTNLPATMAQNEAAGYTGRMAVGSGSMIVSDMQMQTPNQASRSSFDGNDETTRVMAAESEAPFLRISSRDGTDEQIRLSGNRWVAGREDGSDIFLNDRKSSRRQFELSSTPQGYFVRDLGSSNGTSLNGVQLAPDELKAIRSGDVIQVGHCLVHFEIRDPHFEKKLMIVPPMARADRPIVMQSNYEMINYPVPTTGGGAVRMDGGGRSGGLMARFEGLPIPFSQNLDEAKRKKARFWMIIGIILLPLITFLMMSDGQKAKKPVSKMSMGFEKLSPKQQQNVREIYAVAQHLYLQQPPKLALAGAQLQKLHELLPEGFENSLAMAQECAQQAELESQLALIDQQKREQEELRRIVEKNLADCGPLARQTTSIEAITRCLEQSIQRDPDNSKIKEMIALVQQRIDQAHISEMQQKDYRVRAARGKSLYEKAFQLESSGEYLDALEAYKKHISASYPDPENLKELSRKQSFDIQKRMSSKIDDSLRAAEAAYGVGNYREAIDDIFAAKKLDPHNEHAAELNGKYHRELNMKMREVYEESVISEGLGNVEEAKVRWKKILDTDHPSGEYYKKAKDKMRTYGQY